MSTIWGVLDIADRHTTVDSVGQRAVYDAVTELVNRHNAELAAAASVFVEAETTDYSETYYLPAGGMLQESTRLTRPAAVKPTGSYSVAYDLRDGRDQMAWDDVAIAYMTLDQMQAALRTVLIRDQNWIRFHILRHLLNKTNTTFVDEVRGSLTIRRLANSDSTSYPPVIGSSSEADDNHYLVSGYAASAISDTNNPFVTIKAEIKEHFGDGEPVVFFNDAQTAKVEALTDFVPVSDRYVREGASTATLSGVLGNVPGTVKGRVNGVWAVEWSWMPANYMYGQDIMQPAPLKKRIDLPTNIPGRGMLELVAEQDEFPLMMSVWRHREGYGVGNRLNGVALELTTDGSFDTPTTYA